MIDVRRLHYGFKVRYNDLDSNKGDGWEIPEVDVFLNKGHNAFILENIPNTIGNFEVGGSIRQVEALQPIIARLNVDSTQIINTEPGVYAIKLPPDYFALYKVRYKAFKCSTTRIITGTLVSQDDAFDTDPFATPSFEWEELNVEIEANQLITKTDGTFTIKGVESLQYVKVHPYIHNAADYFGGNYTSIEGSVLSGRQHSLLNMQWAENRIVELAVQEALLLNSNNTTRK